MRVSVCECVSEGGREWVKKCVCVCVCEGERESVCVCVRVSVSGSGSVWLAALSVCDNRQ